jgi:hypothetical protein
MFSIQRTIVEVDRTIHMSDFDTEGVNSVSGHFDNAADMRVGSTQSSAVATSFDLELNQIEDEIKDEAVGPGIAGEIGARPQAGSNRTRCKSDFWINAPALRPLPAGQIQRER